jgi:hypothetical protein
VTAITMRLLDVICPNVGGRFTFSEATCAAINEPLGFLCTVDRVRDRPEVVS